MNRSFLEQDTLLVAEQLIGCYLVRQTDHGIIRMQITETEAYKGADDPASHAFKRMTPRNKLMFGAAGHLYVYMIYGLHFCLNVVAHQPDKVGAVLLRGGIVMEGANLLGYRPSPSGTVKLDGPAKLAKALHMTKVWNGYDLIVDPDHCLTLQVKDQELAAIATPRIGISAGKELLWRFVVK